MIFLVESENFHQALAVCVWVNPTNVAPSTHSKNLSSIVIHL